MENAAYALEDFRKVFEVGKILYAGLDMEKCEKIFNEKDFIAAYTEILQQWELLNPGKEKAGLYYFIECDDKVIELLEKALETHKRPSSMEYSILEYLGTGFFDYSRLYNNPRFIAILNEMKLPLPKTD